MLEKRCITFAGVVGSSKTPIAHYLSWNLGLPIFSNDAIRTEVTEDLRQLDAQEYIKRRDERKRKLIEGERSFIYDASMDREWKHLQELLSTAGYLWFIISLDLSKAFIEEIYKAKNFVGDTRLDSLLQQHQNFLDVHGDQVSLHIGDDQFRDRLALSLEAARQWLKG